MPTYRIKDAGGAVVAEHVRTDLPSGKKSVVWRRPGHAASEGLMGLSTSDLPLYGAHLLARLEPGLTVAVAEGDDAADFADRGGTRSEALDLIARAKRVEAVYVEPRRPAARQMAPSYGESEDRKDRAREELADVVLRRLGAPTRREGRSLFWRCPFHDEKTASFKVDLKEPFFRCFGCGARGDVFSFLGRLDGRSFKETLSALAPSATLSSFLERYAE
jgi:hypothetical protein